VWYIDIEPFTFFSVCLLMFYPFTLSTLSMLSVTGHS